MCLYLVSFHFIFTFKCKLYTWILKQDVFSAVVVLVPMTLFIHHFNYHPTNSFNIQGLLTEVPQDLHNKLLEATTITAKCYIISSQYIISYVIHVIGEKDYFRKVTVHLHKKCKMHFTHFTSSLLREQQTGFNGICDCPYSNGKDETCLKHYYLTFHQL